MRLLLQFLRHRGESVEKALGLRARGGRFLEANILGFWRFGSKR